ncbi:type I-C CRISPR-associated protein Cas7/Csd2 [Bacillus niameyensis]|uniref:type I-C CRISPR-associated protein Cas7/Csd2 n=1 Tax=Bacillus niameyensis TaxID=1522308 RepID=UPI000782CED0|nr:type I-C CRISPR-associated protein Cas7/Csd2 [Bacillus niameyensis]
MFKHLSDQKKRYDFMFIFDVLDGNPNGDPDAGNLPRIDVETMQGLVTDVALKRKVRNYVQMTRGKQPGYDIYIKHRGILSREQQKAYESVGVENAENPSANTIKDARDWMCAHYYDVRMFGAVMSGKKYNAGQVRGPLQLTFARSVDPITPFDMTITRVALTNANDSQKDAGEDEVEARHGQMGRKAYVPYGLYVAHGFYTPMFAEQTGVKGEDLELFWESLINMWDLDRSAARGQMATRGLYIFEHESEYGNAPSHTLFEKINIKRKNDVEVIRSSKDYTVEIDHDIPAGVQLHEVITL